MNAEREIAPCSQGEMKKWRRLLSATFRWAFNNLEEPDQQG